METVIVANRGEIAVRILATVRRLGLRGVAVYSDADVGAPHVGAADDAYRLGPAPAAESYLDVSAILRAARDAGADALHPGYGFLAEDPALARACAEAGISFIGPPPDAMAAMGDKIGAKQTVEKAGVPVVPGVHEAGLDDEALLDAAGEIGYPLLVKAAGGGGGRGMRAVRAPEDLPEALRSARREAAAAFGSDALLLERLVERPRHIEVQILADAHGNVLAVGERECSLQRRHQKIVEECPSPGLDEGSRAEMAHAAVAAARACGYVGAGTVEFLVDQTADAFYFLEMNARLQVEHPVTELVYGLDLVEWQLRIAAGEALDCEIRPVGHAVEARVYAEDPSKGFLPTGGTVDLLAWPRGVRAGPFLGRPAGGVVRVDSGIAPGSEVGTRYDPLLAKVVAHGPDRAAALRQLRAALGETAILGVVTNVGFVRALLADPDVVAGRLDTGLVERRSEALSAAQVDDHLLAAVALSETLALEPRGPVAGRFDVPDAWRVGGRSWTRWRVRIGERAAEVALRGRAGDALVAIDGADPVPAAARPCEASAGVEEGASGGDAPGLQISYAGVTRRYLRHGGWFWRDGHVWRVETGDELVAARTTEGAVGGGPVVAPMPGTVIAVEVEPGDQVAAGQTLVVVEAMKMEQPVASPIAGVVQRVPVAVGARVAMEQVLAEVTPADAES